MFGPSSPWPPCSCAPSSVTQWLLYRTVLITVLFAMASSKDWRQDLQSDFTGHVQTIGPLDGRLWAITTEWTVHEMTPCDKGNETLSLCIEIGFPVQVDTKWPELAKSVKENANMVNFNFAVDNSVFMDSSDNAHFLIMHGKDFKPKGFFGFNFSANVPKEINGQYEIFNSPWISSDEKNKTYRLFESGKTLMPIVFSFTDGAWNIRDTNNPGPEYICKVTSESEVSLRITTDDCTTKMDWTVLKAVRYGGQFYFFAKDKVYIFAAVKNVDTKVYTLSYGKFIHCKEPTTTKPPSTHPRITTSKGFNKTVIIVVAIVGLALLVIILMILAFVCCKKPSKVNSKSSAQPYSGSKAGNKESLEKAGSSKKIKTQSRPSKMAKSLAGPSKVAESKAGPSKVAESKAGPSKVAESKAGPSKVAESKAGPSKVAESKAGPSKVAESKAGPSKVAESQVGPSKIAESIAEPKKKAEPKATPKKKADPKATPKKKAEAKSTPKKKTEAKSTPKKKAEPKATPKKKAEPKAKPSKKDESKAGPSKNSLTDSKAGKKPQGSLKSCSKQANLSISESDNSAKTSQNEYDITKDPTYLRIKRAAKYSKWMRKVSEHMLSKEYKELLRKQMNPTVEF